MARDERIVRTDRVIHAARRWAALAEADEADRERETLRRAGDLIAAVRSYEKLLGLRLLSCEAPKRRRTLKSSRLGPHHIPEVPPADLPPIEVRRKKS